MTEQQIDKNISDRICKHMNLDHKDALLGYARFYGGIQKPVTAEMIEINSQSMHLIVDGKELEINFDHSLKDSSDAHQTLVGMIKNIPN